MASNSEGGKPSQISAREALNVLPNTATVKDTAALDAYQEQETAAGNRPAPKKFYEHTDGETAFWKKVRFAIGPDIPDLCISNYLLPKTAGPLDGSRTSRSNGEPTQSELIQPAPRRLNS